MEKEKQKKTFKRIYVYGSLVAILILTVAIFYPKYKTELNKNGKTVSSSKPEYHGFMMLTLNKYSDENAVPNVAILNLDKSNIRFFDNGNGSAVNMTPDGLAGKFIGVVSSLPASQIGTNDQALFQLYTIDMKNNFARKQLTTDSDVFFKRNPKWSSDGNEVAFMAQKSNDITSSDPDDWNIYVTDLTGNEKEIGAGAYPQWSPDNKSILAMKSDGLYLYDVASGNSQKVSDIPVDKASLSDNMNVSADGKLLAFSTFNGNEIKLMKISSWAPFGVKDFKDIKDVTGLSPVFSPDMKSLAMIVVNKDGDNYGNMRLSVYNFEKSHWDDLADLSQYSAGSISLTVWGMPDNSINI